MSSSDLEIEGLAEFDRAMDKVARRTNAKEMGRAMGELMKPVQQQARAVAPFDRRARKGTPHLRSKIGRRQRKGSGRTSTVASAMVGVLQPGPVRRKGFAQEFGTSRHGAQPFLRPTLEQHRARLISGLAAFMRKRVAP